MLLLMGKKIGLSRRTENGIYYYRLKNSKWQSTGSRSYDDAIAFITAVLLHPQQNTTPQDMLYSDFFQIFLSAKTNDVAQSTIRSYSSCSNYFKKICGNKKLSEYSELDLDKLKNYYCKIMKPNSVNVIIRSMKVIFNFAVDREYLQKSPCRHLKQMKSKKNVEYLTTEQLRLILENANNPTLRNLIIFGFCTGARLGEILHLKWKNLDFSNRIIHIISDDTHKTKTGESRTIPMHDSLYNIFLKLPQNDGFVFSKSEPNSKFSAGFITHYFKKLIRKSHLQDSLHFHSLRHSCASNMLNNAVPLIEVSKILGHSTLNITSDVYSHLSCQRLQNSINTIQI